MKILTEEKERGDKKMQELIKIHNRIAEAHKIGERHQLEIDFVNDPEWSDLHTYLFANFAAYNKPLFSFKEEKDTEDHILDDYVLEVNGIATHVRHHTFKNQRGAYIYRYLDKNERWCRIVDDPYNNEFIVVKSSYLKNLGNGAVEYISPTMVHIDLGNGVDLKTIDNKEIKKALVFIEEAEKTLATLLKEQNATVD